MDIEGQIERAWEEKRVAYSRENDTFDCPEEGAETDCERCPERIKTKCIKGDGP